MYKRLDSKQTGFTIVELLIVVVVIGILAAIAVVAYNGVNRQAVSAGMKSELSSAARQINLDKVRTNTFPASLAAANEGRGISAGQNRNFQYSGSEAEFCLEVTSTRYTDLVFSINQDGTVSESACPSATGPAWTLFTYNTALPGCGAARTIQLPVSAPTSAPGSIINWGDGSSEPLTSTLQAHTYAAPGVYTVAYNGPITTINTNSITSTRRPCLSAVTQWGSGVNPTKISFQNSTNITNVATPPLSVTDMSSMFRGAIHFNQPIGSWNTSNVTRMGYMFYGAAAFNQPLNSWDTARVTDMTAMFSVATAFNQPIGSWNVRWVGNMSSMFERATSFNQPIGSWNTAALTSMVYMFAGATSFNQPLNTWNTSNVTDMGNMFNGATAFNQPLNSWSTANVVGMSFMFNDATSFNQNLSSWNTGMVDPKPPVDFAANTPSWVLPKPTW